MLKPIATYTCNMQSKILYKVNYALKHLRKLFIIQTDGRRWGIGYQLGELENYPYYPTKGTSNTSILFYLSKTIFD